MGMLKEFKEFAMKGNIVDLAVAVIIGGAFGKIINSLVEDIIMPVLLKPASGKLRVLQILQPGRREDCFPIGKFIAGNY